MAALGQARLGYRSARSMLGVAVAVVLVVVTTALAQLPGRDVAAQTVDRNFLFVAIDDLRNWLGYTGGYGGTIHTPNIDALAAQSTRFTNAYTTVPLCPGARTSVMLGMSPETHGIWSDIGPWSPEYQDLYSDPNVTSLPEVLSANGYHTATAGKVFHDVQPGRWDEQGPDVDSSFQIEGLLGSGLFPQVGLQYVDPRVFADTETHTDQKVADYFVNFLTTYAEPKPFFFGAGIFTPHVRWNVPQWAYDLYPLEEVVVHIPDPADFDDEPRQALAMAEPPFLEDSTGTLAPQDALVEAQGKRALYTQAYLAAVSYADSIVGQLVDALDASPYSATTDIILWSDQGFSLGEKGHWNKNTIWESVARVPLLVRASAASYPIGDNGETKSLLDLAPTVLDLAGVAPHPQFEGQPLHVSHGSPAYVYARDAIATVNNGIKVVDYDRFVANGIDDMALYWTQYDPNETRNIICPFVRAIFGLAEDFCDR